MIGDDGIGTVGIIIGVGITVPLGVGLGAEPAVGLPAGGAVGSGSKVNIG